MLFASFLPQYNEKTVSVVRSKMKEEEVRIWKRVKKAV